MFVRNHSVFCDVVLWAAVTCGAAWAIPVPLPGAAVCSPIPVPRDVRGEGVTELVGDFVLSCSGGNPTPTGQPVPLVDFHVELSVPLTSRTTGTALPAGGQTQVTTSEATLLIDEPFPANPFPTQVPPLQGSPLQQIGCLAAGGTEAASANPYTHTLNGTVGQCEILGTGTGASTYRNQYNTFQGVATWDPLTGAATIDFYGVPFDPAGNDNARAIRIANLRGNMTPIAGVSPSGVAVSASVTVPAASSVIYYYHPATVTVANIFQGLVPGNCTWSSPTLTCPVEEGQPAGFRTAVLTSNDQSLGGQFVSLRNAAGGTLETQNIAYMDEAYFTESALTVPLTSYTGSGPGQATHGTWIMAWLWNIPAGVQITAPGVVNGGAVQTQYGQNLQLYRVDVTPGWTFNPAFYASPPADKIIVDTTGANPPTTATVVYEVVADNPNVTEIANIPLTVASRQGMDASGIQGAVSFAPLETVPLDSALPSGNAWELPQALLDIPRFMGLVPSAITQLQITGEYLPEQPLTAQFSFTNSSPVPFTFKQIQPVCIACPSGYPAFRALPGTTLLPGQAASYSDTEMATAPGTFSFTMEYQRSDNTWVTGITGSGSPVTVTIPLAYTLTVNVSPAAGGTASATPSGNNGGYVAGTSVCLNETPNSGYGFWMWSGAPAIDDGPSVDQSCLNVNANTTVTANFVPLAGPSGVNNRSFVSVAGNDANNCAVTSPCRTLARALAMTNGGGEIIVLDSGGYEPTAIAQPVTISANGVAASITVPATGGSAMVINTPGNVTIRGIALHGLGLGFDGIDVQQVGILRLYDVTAENFFNFGVEMAAAGDLAIYDSRFTDNLYGLIVMNGSARVYVRNTSFDHNKMSGVSAEGATAAAGASAHFNETGFTTNGGTWVLARDVAALNSGYGIGGLSPSALGQFASCSVALNTVFSYTTYNSSLSGTSPGSTLAIGTASGTLASPTILQ